MMQVSTLASPSTLLPRNMHIRILFAAVDVSRSLLYRLEQSFAVN